MNIPQYGTKSELIAKLREEKSLDSLLNGKAVHRLTKYNVHKYRECTCQTQLIKPCCRTRERVFLLSQQPDFVAQRTSVEELFHRRGHLVLFGVKCHPEIAGLGIEYDWGKYVIRNIISSHSLSHTHRTQYYSGHSKRLFRNQYNDDGSGKQLEMNVRKSMATPEYNTCVSPLFDTGPLKNRHGDTMTPPMTKALVCRFARRTRNYERIYDRFPTSDAMARASKSAGCNGYELIEKLYKICSVSSVSHRSTFDQEKGLLAKVARDDSNAFTEDSLHACLRCVGFVDSNDVDKRV